MRRRTDRIGWRLIAAALLAAWPAAARAQGAVTQDIPETDPTTYAYRLGPLMITPGLTVREVGIDNNVFDETENPKRDFVVSVQPDLSAHARFGLFRLALLSSADFTYYHKYASERSVSRQSRARLDFGVARLRPWIAGGLVQTRTRPNFEIDLRARRESSEMSAGVSYELSPTTRIHAGASSVKTRFFDAQVYEGVDLGDVLSRRTESAQLGLRMQLTPFTTVTVQGGLSRDLFDDEKDRDSETRGGSLELTFGSEAFIRGRLRLGYNDFRPEDPALEPYRGVVSSIALAHTLLSRARVELDLQRGVQYSFEESEGYFVETSGTVAVTPRLFGAVDFQVRYGRADLDYAERADRAGRHDWADTYGFGFGYNLQDRSRVGLNYEYTERHSDERPDRRFVRQRVFGSWQYTF